MEIWCGDGADPEVVAFERRGCPGRRACGRCRAATSGCWSGAGEGGGKALVVPCYL